MAQALAQEDDDAFERRLMEMPPEKAMAEISALAGLPLPDPESPAPSPAGPAATSAATAPPVPGSGAGSEG